MVNKVVLQGRLTRDPELRNTNNGVEVVGFTVAWSEKYKETETKCFLNCTAWRQTGIFVNNYFSKGQEIIVEGKLATRSYEDKDGNKRTATELTVDKAHFCGSKSDNAGQAAHSPEPSTAASPCSSDFEELVGNDEELPF